MPMTQRNSGDQRISLGPAIHLTLAGMSSAGQAPRAQLGIGRNRLDVSISQSVHRVACTE